jgi:uncharacterized protein (TIGR03435 family)
MTAAAWGQAAGPVFDVADVRMYKPDAGFHGVEGIMRINGVLSNMSQIPGQRIQPGDPVYAPNGKVTMRSVTLQQIIGQAYKEAAGISQFQNTQTEYITGGPSWLNMEHYDLIAKAPPGTPLDTERLMLQAVLAERFHLAVHREQKPMPVFALVVGKKELKLKPAAGPGDPDCKAKVLGDGVAHRECTNMTMAGLASRLQDFETSDIDQPAVDFTGIAGIYDFRLDWVTSGRAGPDRASSATMFDALANLGLKLEARKAPMTVVVIDRVDRVPTEN